MSRRLKTTAERWEVDLEGLSVVRLTIDWGVTLHLQGDSDDDGSVRLESDFGIGAAGREPTALDSDEKATLIPVLECYGKAVARLVISRSTGALELTFADGTVISAPSDDEYEAWGVNAFGMKIFAIPGGGEPALFG